MDINEFDRFNELRLIQSECCPFSVINNFNAGEFQGTSELFTYCKLTFHSQLEPCPIFFRNFLLSPVSRIVPKNVKGAFGDIEKKSHKAEITCTKKFWSRAGLEPTSFCLADLKKPSASRSSVAVSVSASQLIKSVTSLVLKSHCCGLRFLRKAPTKKFDFPMPLMRADFLVFFVLVQFHYQQFSF